RPAGHGRSPRAANPVGKLTTATCATLRGLTQDQRAPMGGATGGIEQRGRASHTTAGPPGPPAASVTALGDGSRPRDAGSTRDRLCLGHARHASGGAGLAGTAGSAPPAPHGRGRDRHITRPGAPRARRPVAPPPAPTPPPPPPLAALPRRRCPDHLPAAPPPRRRPAPP